MQQARGVASMTQLASARRAGAARASVPLPLRSGWTRRAALWRRTASRPAVVPGANSGAWQPEPADDSGGLQQLRSSSENLRRLLERRAQRQQQRQGAPDSWQQQQGQPESAALVPAAPAAQTPAAPPGAGRGGDLDAGATARRSSKVRFWLKYRAEWGQRLKVVGSSDTLGSWRLEGAPELKWSEGDMWHTTVELPAGCIAEYKYVLLDHSGQHAVAWQRGNNSVLAVRHSDEFVEVFDNWGGDPGAKVVADGGVPATREGRLLSWAGEIEAQVATQKAELRRARMELVAAQEEAKMARQDAQRYRAQLAQQEKELNAALERARELQLANTVLQAQLADATGSFRQALETAAELLQHTDEVIGAAVAAVGPDVEVASGSLSTSPGVNGSASKPGMQPPATGGPASGLGGGPGARPTSPPARAAAAAAPGQAGSGGAAGAGAVPSGRSSAGAPAFKKRSASLSPRKRAPRRGGGSGAGSGMVGGSRAALRPESGAAMPAGAAPAAPAAAQPRQLRAVVRPAAAAAPARAAVPVQPARGPAAPAAAPARPAAVLAPKPVMPVPPPRAPAAAGPGPSGAPRPVASASGAGGGEGKPLLGGVVAGGSKPGAAAPSVRAMPSLRARKAVKVAAVPVAGSSAAGPEPGLGSGLGWRNGQRLKLSRDLVWGGNALDLDPSGEQ